MAIEVNKLKRQPDKIIKLLKEVDDTLVCLEDLRVTFPSRYVNKDLALLSTNVATIGIFAILDNNDNYGVFNIPATIELEPNKIEDVKIDNVDYKVLYFDKGDIFTNNVNLIKKESFMHDLFDEFFIKGKIPWFLNYEDASSIFRQAKKYAGSKIGDDILAMEIIASIVARNPENPKEYYRLAVKSREWVNKNKPLWVGLKNPYLTFSNTTAKLVGAYFNDGITSSIIDPEDKPTKIEEVLRD